MGKPLKGFKQGNNVLSLTLKKIFVSVLRMNWRGAKAEAEDQLGDCYTHLSEIQHWLGQGGV